MKTSSKAMAALILILYGTLGNELALAQHHGHKYGHKYGYTHGHNHGPIVRFGFSYGFPIYTPRYVPTPLYTYPGYAFPAPVYVYPPAVIGYSSPQVYIERGVAQAEPVPPQAINDWYYCAASKTYYPYARECPEGWQRVPAQPPLH